MYLDFGGSDSSSFSLFGVGMPRSMEIVPDIRGSEILGLPIVHVRKITRVCNLPVCVISSEDRCLEAHEL